MAIAPGAEADLPSPSASGAPEEHPLHERAETEASSSEKLQWGSREEPFLSPLDYPRAIRIPTSVTSRFQLTGILWDAQAPSCVVSGNLMRLGETIAGYRLVVLTPRAAILQGTEEEILLFLP